MDYLWAGWRSAFVTQGAPAVDGCVLCAIGDGADGADDLVVARRARAFCVLNLYPYTSGHLMVVPRRHGSDLGALSHEELGEMWELVREGMAALESAYHPQGINLGLNLGRASGAGIVEHLHVHVVPRWVGDANFMVTAAQTRVLPEALGDTRDRLRRAWPASS
ncbi:histidine triad (HIT) protein [Acidimicrobium ferrooxidans DSM 10331]|uniref:Histidine triad (HIT) protein n=1 Tax=Acidimicrobium ferrooxidans (strain DSM 10331 / JCM 15462 / NBRC 103882 / ICP) TaxID=525909 RepID=C7LZK1_ACIFD|nr:HIT domain-containing protein [Acidimicrobium ferrooxidans]ACU54159.1 histidine triad (HIT) protein [Acidimicrobium ferrooxidans DSM 10331]